MPIKACVFIAISLDGFISRPDGSIDWLNQAYTLIPEGEDLGFRDFMDKTDALVMGRNTFAQALTFSEWLYSEKMVVVMSHKSIKIPEALKESVITSSEAPAVLLNWLALRGARQVYVDGGQTIQSFLREGLISELTITTIPILLGAGKPLFGSLNADIKLMHIFTKPYPFGFVQSRYAVVNDSGAQMVTP